MYWSDLYSGSLFWESPALVLAVSWNVVFNWYNLQTNNIVTNKITVDNFPEVEYIDYNIPRWRW